jgi:hypothetical protein
MGEMEERCLRNLLRRGLSVFGRPERAEVLGLRAPVEALRKTVLENMPGNSGLRMYTGRDREAKMEILAEHRTAFRAELDCWT